MNLCEVDVFEGYSPCDEPGSVAYEDGETKILLCVNHATELARSRDVSPQVFRKGDPPPGPEVKAVMDNKGEIWPQVDEVTWQCPGGARWSWEDALVYGPLVACEPLPDYDAAVEADAKRREEERHA